MSEEMKKLVIDGTEFEIVDAAGRDRITVLENTTPSGGGLSITEKNLILQLFGKAAYAEDDAGSAYSALSNLWIGSYRSVAWEGSGYTKSNSETVIEDGGSFTSTITANAGKTIESVAVTMGGETVQGAYSGGTVTIPNVTGNIVITVTTAQMTVSSISAVYTQSGTVYDTDTLDSLKNDLVVTATFPDSSTAVIPASDYTLSGNLLVGTSTITVNCAGKTASFNVTVTTHYTLYDYIYNSHTTPSYNQEYVDTGLTFNPSFNALNLEFEAMNSNDSSSVDAVLGANTNSISDTGTILWYSRGNKAGFSAFLLGTSAKLENVAGDTRAIVKYTFVNGGQSTIESGEYSADVATVSKSSITTNAKSLILAGGRKINTANDAYGILGTGRTKVGYIKFTDPDTDELVYHFIPAYNPDTNKYGFYEAVNDVFYPSNGTHFRGGNWS